MGDDVVDTDELHYTQKDAAMTPEEEEEAFKERYGDDSEFSEQEVYYSDDSEF